MSGLTFLYKTAAWKVAPSPWVVGFAKAKTWPPGNGHCPYKCTACKIGFWTLAFIHIHTSTHMRSRHCWCEYCGTTFATSGELIKHMEYKHAHAVHRWSNEPLTRKYTWAKSVSSVISVIDASSPSATQSFTWKHTPSKTKITASNVAGF